MITALISNTMTHLMHIITKLLQHLTQQTHQKQTNADFDSFNYI